MEAKHNRNLTVPVQPIGLTKPAEFDSLEAIVACKNASVANDSLNGYPFVWGAGFARWPRASAMVWRRRSGETGELCERRVEPSGRSTS
jgi:hypothetical protein